MNMFEFVIDCINYTRKWGLYGGELYFGTEKEERMWLHTCVPCSLRRLCVLSALLTVEMELDGN